jgi:hypothetical protein
MLELWIINIKSILNLFTILTIIAYWPCLCTIHIHVLSISVESVCFFGFKTNIYIPYVHVNIFPRHLNTMRRETGPICQLCFVVKPVFTNLSFAREILCIVVLVLNSNNELHNISYNTLLMKLFCVNDFPGSVTLLPQITGISSYSNVIVVSDQRRAIFHRHFLIDNKTS